MGAKVYFSRNITSEMVLELYKMVGKELPGKVAVKLHSGEKGNQNFLKPDFWQPVIDYVNGTVVECNTAYEGARNTTEKHRRLIAEHGWDRYFEVDLLDAEGPDLSELRAATECTQLRQQMRLVTEAENMNLWR